jgi:hypothetical protein
MSNGGSEHVLPSQISSPSSRLRLLTTLVQQRGGSTDKITKLNKFTARVTGLAAGGMSSSTIVGRWTNRQVK